MTYMINARLEQGAPSLTLIDAMASEERLHWHDDTVTISENSWKCLFKRLILLSCADRLNLVQRTKSPAFGDECIDQNAATETQTPSISAMTKNTPVKTMLSRY